jgi:uncharacterized membrane protein YphA (DoxX/SURF4 family)
MRLPQHLDNPSEADMPSGSCISIKSWFVIVGGALTLAACGGGSTSVDEHERR